MKIVEGGSTRQASSYCGLLACNTNTDIVIIHDAVRPFVSKMIISENIEKAIKYKAVNTCIDTSDTIVQSLNRKKIEKIPKRETLLRGQTPQTFDYNVIVNAHKQAITDNILDSTDDCSLALKRGIAVHIVKGDEYNIKITNKLDLFIAEQLFRVQSDNVFESNNSLKDKLYVVVGATGGIGQALIDLLNKEKAKVIPLSRSTNIKIDLTSIQSIKDAFQHIFEKYGEIDGLINSAGLLNISPLKNMDNEEIEKLIKINLTGLIISCKEAKMKKEGHIINIASSSSFKGRENSSIYSSCKAAVVNFTQAIANEYPNMKINTIIPQRTNTPMRRKNFPDEDSSILLPPEKVATAIINLLKNKKITGSIVEVKAK